MNNLSDSNNQHAIFLPSISSFYARFCSNYYTLKETGPRKGKLPEWLVHGFESLDFLNPEKGLFFYDKGLYSAGHAVLDIEKSNKIESMVQGRDRSKTWILGDSGGYQIASGILDFDWADIKSQNADNIRQKILNWLEHTSDYAMLFDFPTRAIANPRASSLNSFKDCLDGSKINFEYFIEHRKNQTKYLNVLQGRTPTEADVWFNEVKDYPFEGWAFGGFNMKDFEMILSRLVYMRDNHYFEKNIDGNKRHWLHFLGQSRLIAACAFSHCQKILQEQVDPELKISYDSASAFIAVAHAQVYTRNSFDKKKMSYIMEKMIDDKSLVGSELPFPWQGIIGDNIRMKDISVKDINDKSKTSWDSFSYMLLMAHNVEYHIKAVQTANRLYDMPTSQVKDLLPTNLIEFRDVVEEVFSSEKPYDVIAAHKRLLNNLTGLKTEKEFFTSYTDLFEENKAPDIDNENEDTELLKLEKDNFE